MKEEYNHSYISVNNFGCFTTKNIDCINLSMNYGERLKIARQNAKLSQVALAEKVKISQANISKLEIGDATGSEFTVQFAQACHVNPQWLATGEGSMALPLAENNATSNSKIEPISLVDNPAYPSIRRVNLRLSAGIVGFSIEHDVEDKSPIVMQRQWFESRGYNPTKLLATGLKGDSMSPGMNDGDTIVINTEDTTPADGIVFAINYEGEMLVKRMVRDAGTWWLSSDNPDQRKYPRKQCTNELCLIIGRIVHKQSEVI